MENSCFRNGVHYAHASGQKAKDADVIGVLAGTLGVGTYAYITTFGFTPLCQLLFHSGLSRCDRHVSKHRSPRQASVPTRSVSEN